MPFLHASNHDVIVVGAGPVGLLLACELRLAGCSVLVLERDARPESPLKALPFGLRGLTVPTMDALDRRDLLVPLRERTGMRDVTSATHWSAQARRPAGHFAGLQFHEDRVDGGAWPYRVDRLPAAFAATMADLEAVLAERAEALGVAIRRACPLERLRVSESCICAQAGGQAFEAAWLVGCDGARSTVRKAAGFAFAGTEPEFTGYSALVRLDDPGALEPGRHQTAGGTYTYTPPGTIGLAEFDGGAWHRAGRITRDHVEAVLRRVSRADVRVEELELATTWTDRAFLADEYRRGRVLLAGDAAHIHSPLGGQGLNLGLGDAMNLGWKLGSVVRGTAPAGLLDSYGGERRPVAGDVLEWSRAQVALMRPDPGSSALRAVMRELMETVDGATFFAGRVKGMDLRYDLGGAHPLVGRSAPDLALSDGGRLNERLRDGRGLMVRSRHDGRLQAAPAGSSTGLRHVEASADDLGASAMLVRPDGIVAWARDGTVDGDEARAQVSRWFSRRA